MFTNKHPWQNFDEIQTLWRLGRFDRPPIPQNLSPEAIAFLDKTFEVDPEKRSTAEDLLTDPFTSIKAEEFDFKLYKENAILRKQQQDLDDEEDDDEEEEDEDDDENEESDFEPEDDEAD